MGFEIQVAWSDGTTNDYPFDSEERAQEEWRYLMLTARRLVVKRAKLVHVVQVWDAQNPQA